MKEIEDLYLTEEFKSLPRHKRIWFRLKVAFFQSLTMF